MENKPHDPTVFTEQLERLTSITGTTSQKALGAVLGISQAAVSDALRRNHLPPGWLLELLRLRLINPDWILFGQPPQYLVPLHKGQVHYTPSALILQLPDLEGYTTEALLAELMRRGQASALQQAKTPTL